MIEQLPAAAAPTPRARVCESVERCAVASRGLAEAQQQRSALTQPDSPDMLGFRAVAATARYLEYGILVGRKDERHFREVPGVRVVPLA
jgi:hypothetical protein